MNISIFSPATSFGRFFFLGGGGDFAQDVFKLRRYIEKRSDKINHNLQNLNVTVSHCQNMPSNMLQS